MITQEDIDAMDDGMGLVEFLRDDMTGCPGEWYKRKEAADRIEQLERELAAEKALADRIAAKYAMSLNDNQMVRECPALSAYRKSRRAS